MGLVFPRPMLSDVNLAVDSAFTMLLMESGLSFLPSQRGQLPKKYRGSSLRKMLSFLGSVETTRYWQNV